MRSDSPADPWESRVRREAIAWLTVRTNDGQRAMTTDEVLEFTVDGEPFRLMDAQRGIRTPKGFAGALSIRTVYTPPGKGAPYDDRVGPDGLVRYKWRGLDPDHAENRALREAMVRQLPLIWFFGVGTATYLPVFPSSSSRRTGVRTSSRSHMSRRSASSSWRAPERRSCDGT